MLTGPLTGYPFIEAGHDRLAERRRDADFLDGLRADDKTRVLLVRGDQLSATDDGRGLRFVSPIGQNGELFLLGQIGGVVCLLSPVLEGYDDGGGWADLRRLVPHLDVEEASLAVHAVSVGGWHQRHPHCSVCGAETEASEAGASRRCPSCGAQHFPRTDPAVIMLVADDQGRCLLGHNAARESTWYSTLAGFVEPGESPEQAVRREVFEETGVRVGEVRYAGSQPWPFPSSLMLGYFADATSAEISVDGEEIDKARWFTPAELREEIEAGRVVVPTTISISGALLTAWFGGPLPPNQPSQA